jgi:putative ABC transport system permease protein
VALSFVLLFAALLFTGTLRNLLAVDTGFDATDVTVARLDFRTLDLSPAARPAFKRELLERLEAAPGVLSAAEVRHVPLGGTGSSDRVRGADEPEGPGTPIRLNGVTAEYFETMGMGLLAGRRFGPADGPDARVAVITRELATRMGLGENPVGETMLSEWMSIPIEVIGMVPDAKYFDLREEPVPTAFVPKALLPDARSYTDFVVRSAAPAEVLREALRAAVDGVSRQIWIDLRPMDDEIRSGLVRERLMSMLSGLFGVLAALVASVGLYGVMSYQVGLRMREIAVRVAIGAEVRDVLRLVLAQAGALLAAGLVAGSALSFLVAAPLRSFLFRLDGQAVSMYVLTAALLALTGAIACVLPARQAATVAPRDALTSE